MAIDLNRVIQATVDAVLEGGEAAPQAPKRSGKPKRRGLSVPRAFLIGAGAVTAGRLVARVRSGELLESLQQRLVDYEQRHFNDDEDNGDEYLEDEEEDEEDEESEPEAEADDDFDEDDEEPLDDEDDEEPLDDEDEEADEGEDYEEDPEAEEEDASGEQEEEQESRPRRRARSAQG